MRIVWFVVVFVCGVKISECKKLEEEYCWRDYKGDIPSDAVPAGRDERGETTYSGQALHSGDRLIPGVIIKGSDKIFYEWGTSAQESQENIKIFCSSHPERYKWLHVHQKNSIFNLNGTQLIISRQDGGQKYCIARKNTGSEIAVGKAILSGTEFGIMWYAKGGNEPKFAIIQDHYEVLVFDPNAVSEERHCAAKVVNIDFYC